MRITREELEVQGIFIPSEVNDELLARFKIGSLVLLNISVNINKKHIFWIPKLFQITDGPAGIDYALQRLNVSFVKEDPINRYSFMGYDGSYSAQWKISYNQLPIILEKLKEND